MAQGFPQGLKQKQQELLAEVQAGRMTPDEAAHALASLANPNFAENFAPRSDRRGMDSRPPQGLTGQGGDDGMSFTENQRVRSPAQGLMGAQTPTPVAPEQQLPPRPQPQVAPQPAPGLLDPGVQAFIAPTAAGAMNAWNPEGSGMPASEVQARDAQIMSPDYNNQGVQGSKPQVAPQPAPGLLDQGALPSADVNMNMQKQFRPSQLGQTPMAMNVDTPMQGNPYGQGEAAAPGPARDVGAEGVVPGGTAYAGLMGREKPGPMNIFGGQGGGSSAPQLPQGQEEPSIFSRLGGGLKSMGKGMSNYTKELFDDPNRMALLQGGLSMMDPNSYYDQQGFGSVFTGLNKGLGAAQGGMQGVLGRRKSRADIAKTNGEASPIDKIEVSSNNLSTFAVNKSKIDRDTKKYMLEGMSENEAFARASAESSANIADKGMKQKDKSALFEEYSTGNLTLSKIKEAKNLVRPDTLSGLATAKRGFDQVLTFAEIAHNPSDATKLKTYMDELAFPMMQAIMGIPINSRMLDSKAEKDFIKDLAGNPTKYSDPAILASKLDMVEKLYSKLQNQRKSDLGYGPPPASGKTLGQKYDY